MVGQKQNIEIIKQWRIKRTTPRFTIISGEGERLELAKVLGKSLNADIIIAGKGIEDIRQTIANSYNTTETTLYIFEKGDEMSNQASNAILKVVEEPPNNAYYTLLCESNSNILPTILNRGTQLNLTAYTSDEIGEIVGDNELMKCYCRTPQQAYEWVNKPKEFEKFIEYCKWVAENIGKITGVEAFRIIEKLKLKKDDTGYDPIMFIRNVYINFNKLGLSWSQEKQIVSICYGAINDLKKVSIKKDSTIDIWILKMREVLKNGK